jgi:hypothetical protein
MKQVRRFWFRYPLYRRQVLNLKLVSEHIGDLEIEGVGYIKPGINSLDIKDSIDVDLEFIRWNGADILPVLEINQGLEEFEEAAIRHLQNGLNKLNQAA